MAVIRFLERGPGRVVRMVAGLAMVGAGVGLATTLGGAWWVLAVVGLVPFAAGALGVCLLAPFVHDPLVTPAHHAS